MNIVIFGLTVSSSWGNGHATLWRSLIRALLQRGHRVCFLERDVSFYADTRDLWELGAGGRLVLYRSFGEIRPMAEELLDRADLAMCTSYCPDGVEACELILRSNARIKSFYDLDTPVTLDALTRGSRVSYLPPDGLAGFDHVFSYTGGRALEELRSRLGARVATCLYGSADPALHRRVAARDDLAATLSYLGTYAEDRQDGVHRLFLEPAFRSPESSFLVGGSQYPEHMVWPENVRRIDHMPPHDHAAFFSSSGATLNVTRRAMAEYGFCPSGRLFEAAACGVPILSDWWDGLDTFFEVGKEILIVRTTDDVLDALRRPGSELEAMGEAARQRVLRDHTGESRIRELEQICNAALRPATGSAVHGTVGVA